MKRTYIFLFLGLMGVSLFLFGPWIQNESLGEEVNLPSSSSSQVIPEDAIRLRVIAHSDDMKDQWLKRKVRDAIVKEIRLWASKPSSPNEARQMIQGKIDQFTQIAKDTVKDYGYSYPVDVTFGKVPFPTKLYGNIIYPAGDYEALRITLGDGKGENWWCVLFPPLCFIDMSSGEAIAEEPDPKETLSASLVSDHQVYTERKEEEKKTKKKNVEVKFFLLDRLKSLWND